jgi:hypothetical protein
LFIHASNAAKNARLPAVREAGFPVKLCALAAAKPTSNDRLRCSPIPCDAFRKPDALQKIGILASVYVQMNVWNAAQLNLITIRSGWAV